jgi:putative toxin-antitoxin system antitoxin component (TIGR02293 family)
MPILAQRVLNAPAAAPETTASLAGRLLGGRKVLRKPVETALQAHDMVLSGLPSAALLHLIDAVGVLSRDGALEKATGMSLRTVQRRRKDAAHSQLSPEQSSRTWRFAEVLAHATEVLGSQEAAERWLESPAIGLENRRPLDLLATDAGADAVKTYLMQMDYGVYV